MIDLIHPANFHYFKNFISIIKEKGHQVQITARNKDVLFNLLNENNIEFRDMGTPFPGFLGKMIYTLIAEKRFYSYASHFKPDIYISFSSSYVAHVSTLLGKPHISFDDTEHAKLNRIIYQPFTDVILSPKSFDLEPSSND